MGSDVRALRLKPLGIGATMLNRRAFLLSLLSVAPSLALAPSAFAEENNSKPSDDEDAAATSEEQLSEQQRNSVNMLNYLAMLTQEVNTNGNSKVYVEEAYTALINNTYPNAVDRRTQTELEALLDILHDYRMINVKRDRLQYQYEQGQAKALKESLPSPVTLLSAVSSFDPKRVAVAVAYMAVETYANYTAYQSELDSEFMTKGWELDDEEASTLHEMRSGMFSYMVDIVRDYGLPGDLALNEQAVQNYVKWKNEDNVSRKIRWFTSNEQTYESFGPYWLTLSKCYYDNGNYKKCLKCIDAYEKLQTRIFRQDYDLASVMPLAFVAAGEVYEGDRYVERAEHFLNVLTENMGIDGYGLSYFAAEAYISLSQASGNKSYLRNAYNLALDSVVSLVDAQESLNKTYVKEIEETEIPSGATKDEEEEIKQYNDLIKKERETELPPINENLALYCEILNVLAGEMELSDKQKAHIAELMEGEGGRLFLCHPINDALTFGPREKDSKYKLELKDRTFVFPGELRMPASLLTGNRNVEMSIVDGDKKVELTGDEIMLKRVERESQGKIKDVDTFTAVFEWTTNEKYDFTDSTRMLVTVKPDTEREDVVLNFEFKVVRSQLLFLTTWSFEQVS